MSVKVEKIRPDQVQKGMYIELPIPWKDNPFLMRKFKIHFDYQINIIRDMTLDHILYYPGKSDSAPLETNESPAREPDNNENQETAREEAKEQRRKLEWEKAERTQKMQEYRSNLQKTEKEFGKSLAIVKDVMGKMTNRPLNAISEASELINSMTDTILGANDLVLHLMTDEAEGESLYYHSLNVTVLSLMIAKAAGLEQNEARSLGMGAMFHDVGKLKIPKKVLLKKEKLNNAERKLIELHPKYGVDLLKLSREFPEWVLPIVDHHHEFLDGTGYPYGLKGNRINKLAQVLAVVNVYDNLCHPPDGKEGRAPSSALSFMYKKMRGKLNPTYLDLLIKMLGVYPPGSVVALSDGRVGLVMSVNSADLLNPEILLYDPEIPRKEAITINLSNTDIKVEKVFKPSQLKSEALAYLSPRTQANYAYHVEPAS
ncbi:MAG: DUF3391 domain-containing protein [Ketobacteraceae bacterium]|nr:DUF3391 domain-containing protein [Ketobacteraceae bacterium]